MQNQLGQEVWSNLAKASQKELCKSFRQYEIIHSESFTASISDYSEAGLGLCCVAEREIVKCFFEEFYQFLKQNSSNQQNRFEIGGVCLTPKSKYTLGKLPPLLACQWKTFKEKSLSWNLKPSRENLYQTKFFEDKVDESDRKLVKAFLNQWSHPLSKWLLTGEYAASKIDQIRLLRNRMPHPVDLYLWQFKKLWRLLIGGDQTKGILQEIYEPETTKQIIKLYS